jgi:hypothetical protein
VGIVRPESVNGAGCHVRRTKRPHTTDFPLVSGFFTAIWGAKGAISGISRENGQSGASLWP